MTFHVGNIFPEAVLGMNLQRKLPFSLSLAEECVFSATPHLLSDFSDVFGKDLKNSKLKHYEPLPVIPIENERPYRAPVRQFSRSDEKLMDQKIAELQAAGVIEPSHSPWRCALPGEKKASIMLAHSIFQAFLLYSFK